MDLPLAAQAEPPSEDEGVSVALEARQLSITLTSATLAYRITLTNNGKARLNGVSITGDLISAHASVPSEAQLAGPAADLAAGHEIASLGAGKSAQVTGEFRLPFALIEPIRKNSAVLFVPLARVRVEAQHGNGNAQLTALIGQRSREPGGGLQPFRLDLGPRIYREVTQRIFS